ncbi:MAG: hypothetical protein GEV06_18035 [Luteitalea sp.]|nr:hypothetical protein [Luteitalea sp.]
MKSIRVIAPVVFVCLLAVVHAQSHKGGISGTVFDTTGAVVAAATVVITNIGTDESLALTTTSSGTFSAPLLDPVEYRITVEAPGFKPSVVPKVKVDTATTATVNVTLQLGELTAETTVVAAPPIVPRASGTPGQTITGRQIVEMPLNNRSVLDLA